MLVLKTSKVSNKYPSLGACILAAALSAGQTASVFALPSTNVTTEAGDATYVVDDATNATISASEDSVLQFTDVGGDAFRINSGEVLHLESTDGAIDVLADIIDTQASEIFGSINGDGNVSLYLRNTEGFVFGENASVLNVPSLVATTNVFNNDDFAAFASGDDVLETMASGGEIVIEDIELQGSELVLIANAVDVDGNVVSDASFRVAIGEKVELQLPSTGSGLLSVDITQALASAGGLSVQRGSSVDADLIDWQVAMSNPASIAVNVRGLVKANGVSVGPDGAINIVGKGGVMFLAGQLDAADGSGDISLTGDNIVLRGSLDAGDVSINLGHQVADLGATEGSLRFSNLINNNPVVTIEGATGFNHSVNGLADYTVNGVNSGTASLEVGGSQTVSFNNVSTLQTVRGDNVITIESGASIDTIIGSERNEHFIIRGSAGSLFGTGGNNIFTMDGGFVTDQIDGGLDLNIIENVVLVEDGQQILDPIDLLSRGGSDFINSWVDIDQVTPGPEIIPIPVTTISTDNLNASTPLFSNLNGAAQSGLQLVGDNLVNTPCGFNNRLADVDGDSGSDVVGAALPVVGKEGCYDTPEYLALLNTTIYFDNDSSVILPPAAEKLDRVSSFVNESKMFREVIVSGHTDSNASETYNLALSKRRAESAIDYMAGQGVDEVLFRSFYYGESLPAVENDSVENMAKNRRVVVELKQ